MLAADLVLCSSPRSQPARLTIPFPAAEPASRSVPATLDLAAQLAALPFDP
jgi:hypothetical protein